MNIKAIWHKIKAIPIIGNTYEKCIGKRKVAYIEKKCKEELINSGEKYIRITENALQNSGAIYYVTSGTLLGAIREGNFISWDFDIDYAIVITAEFTWRELEKIMNKSGFRKTREYVYKESVREQSYAIGKLNIDFFGQFYEGDDMIQYSFENRLDCNYKNENERSVYRVTLPKVVKTKKTMLGNVEVSVPENSEEFLAAMYDENWRIPNPNWKSNSQKGSKLLENEVAYKVL